MWQTPRKGEAGCGRLEVFMGESWRHRCVEGKEEGGVSDGFRPRERRRCGRQSLHRAGKGRSEVSGLFTFP